MRIRLIRLRFRRRIRKGQRQVEDLGVQAEKQIERHIFKRFERLAQVRRFLIGWVGLVVLTGTILIVQNLSLSNYYQTLRPVPGGIYNEGIRGRFTNANPIYATSDADTAVARLIFNGLFTYNQNGHLTGDLAESYAADEHGITYTVHLKPHLKWQDGRPLTSEDVLFTYRLIQNPDAKSPLQSSWQGIDISAPDAHTVVFKLPGPLAAFPYNLTNGIVPKHLLNDIPADDLRSADFNTLRPVGAGPFTWQAITVTGDGNPANAQQKIALEPYKNYQGGEPKLQRFVVQVFASEDQMVESFATGQLTGMEGLTQVPPSLAKKPSLVAHNLSMRAAKMVFFKTNDGVLAEQPVRHALVEGADVPAIIKRLGYPVRQVHEPLLTGQVGYDSAFKQPDFNLISAKAELDAHGWKQGKDGMRSKKGVPLAFTLTAGNTAEGRIVAKRLQQQWLRLGAKVNLQMLDATEFQNTVTYHNYDAILDGISIGEDPDVFVYWDSSQADIRSANRLNLAEYKNSAADTALEAGRTRLNPALRTIKYRPFLKAWQHDSPALALYQPRLLYITNGPVYGLSEHPVNTSIDRFANVQNWQIHQAKVTNR